MLAEVTTPAAPWLVTQGEFLRVIEQLAAKPVLACDLETTGLHPYRGDRLFSMAFADSRREWYFDFNGTLPRDWIELLQPIFGSKGLLLNHNLKFDAHFLEKEGLRIERDLYCTQAMARVEYNEHMRYSLDACGERLGQRKDDSVKKYLDQEGHFEWESVPGKKKRDKRYFFNRVPLHIIGPYACQDTRVAYKLYEAQNRSFEEVAASRVGPSIHQVVANERALTRVCLDLEHTGILVDLPYCRAALAYEQGRAGDASREFSRLAGVPLVDSAKAIGPALQSAGVELGKTDKGADSIADDVLQPHKTNPLVAQLLVYREAMKRANTYFSNYVRLVGPDGRIHVDLKQSGTATGRFSAGEPNLQNLPDPEEDNGPWPVRRAFIPDPGTVLVSIDYAQMEYRLMLDYAQEDAIIEQVLRGVDVHEATANAIRAIGVEITRSQAKNINFALLYGAGIDKLAFMLGCSRAQAQALKHQYFRALRKVQSFIRTVVQTTEKRGYIFNWMGRRCYFPDSNFAYKAPNYLIQGGSADIVKKAMVGVHALLEGRKSKMVLNVHDELLFLMPREELALVPEIVKTMVQAYPHKRLPMECSVAYSERSWADLSEELPA